MRPWTLERVGVIGVGMVGNHALNCVFDYGLYPYTIWSLGLVYGTIVMGVASLVLSYAQILFYDWAKQDWLGIETLKEVREFDGSHILGRIASWVLSKGDWAAFLVCSAVWDPFVTTAYMRHGSHSYNGMSSRDWKIFLSSVVASNLLWSITVFSGVSFLEWFICFVKGTFN